MTLREGPLCCRARSAKGGPRILIGGSGTRRTRGISGPLCGMFGTGIFMDPDTFRECSAALDVLLPKHGRQSHEVKRTLAALCFFGHIEESTRAAGTASARIG